MRPTIYQIERIGSGFLAVMGRPRAGEWVSEEFAGLSRLGIRNLVCLLEEREARELDLGDERDHCTNARIAFHTFPIPDRGVPASPEKLSRRRHLSPPNAIDHSASGSIRNSSLQAALQPKIATRSGGVPRMTPKEPALMENV